MICTVLILLIVAVEGIIKQYIEKTGCPERQPVLHGFLYRTKYHNYGAFLGMGQKHPNLVRAVSFSLCLFCTAIFVLTLGRKGSWLLKAALSILLGGAYSNTYDRMVRGYVVDYFGFNVKNKKLRNIVYNISDFCIMIGAMLATVSSQFGEDQNLP